MPSNSIPSPKVIRTGVRRGKGNDSVISFSTLGKVARGQATFPTGSACCRPRLLSGLGGLLRSRGTERAERRVVEREDRVLAGLVVGEPDLVPRRLVRLGVVADRLEERTGRDVGLCRREARLLQELRVVLLVGEELQPGERRRLVLRGGGDSQLELRLAVEHGV